MRTLLCSSTWCGRFKFRVNWRVLVDIAVWGAWGGKVKASEGGPDCSAWKEKGDGVGWLGWRLKGASSWDDGIMGSSGCLLTTTDELSVVGWWDDELAVLLPDSRSSSSTSMAFALFVNKVFLRKFMVLCIQNFSTTACLYDEKNKECSSQSFFLCSCCDNCFFAFGPAKLGTKNVGDLVIEIRY